MVVDVIHHRPSAILSHVGRVADRNDRGMAGSRLVGQALADRLEVPLKVVGCAEPATSQGWRADLAAAMPGLMQLQAAHLEALADPYPAIVTLPRCASALATLPNVPRLRPDALVVWFDAHPDLNTPASTSTGYLGGMVLSAAVGWWESGLGGELDSDNIVLGGTRDFDPFERNLVDDGVIKLAAGPAMLDDLDSYVGDTPLYFHLDCDVLEPGIVPTEYEATDGLSLEDLNQVALRLADNEVIGLEIAEMEAPDDGDSQPVAQLLDALAPLLPG